MIGNIRLLSVNFLFGCKEKVTVIKAFSLILEFFRGDLERGSIGVLSTSQFISIFTGVAGMVMLGVIKKRAKK